MSVLWYQRNALFHKLGYCFTSGKGLQVFGNDKYFCNHDEAWQAMGEDNRQCSSGAYNSKSGLMRARTKLLRGGARPVRVAILLVGLVLAASVSARGDSGGVSLSERLDALRRAYPELVTDITTTHVLMKDGPVLLIDDREEKSFEEKLQRADIEDMLSQIYPVVGCDAAPVANFDPGRMRNEAFFKAVYGATKRSVERTVVRVDWFGETIAINGSFGLRDKIAAVVAELKPKFSELKSFLVPNGGTFVWRTVAGSDRLSAHSFGIAIDISTKRTEYWRWSKTRLGEPRAVGNKVPVDIVTAFERQGFIWGGNWYHYDTMHFEYRPELIEIGNLAKKRGCVTN